MQLIEHVKQRWAHFLGKDLIDDLESRRKADEAEIEFALALQHMQQARGSFDKRSDPPPAGPTSISGLTAKLELDDKLMREALGDDETDE